MQLFGSASAYARKALSSSSNAITQLCPCVPLTGIPNRRPAMTLEVAAHPPTHAARLAASPPSKPCARRRPNSSTGSPRAARTTRAALVAMRDWKLITLSSGVSMSCAWTMGPVTRTIGSSGNTTVPSGTASTSQVSRIEARWSRNAGSNSFSPSLPRTSPSQARSSASKRSDSMKSMAYSSPQAMVKPPPNGLRRKKRWKAACSSSIPDFQYAYAMVSWYRSVSNAREGRYSSVGMRTAGSVRRRPLGVRCDGRALLRALVGELLEAPERDEAELDEAVDQVDGRDAATAAGVVEIEEGEGGRH